MMAFSYATETLQLIFGVLAVTNLCLLAAERQRLAIQLITIQGFLLGFIPLVAHAEALTLHLVLISFVFLAVKGIVMPKLLLGTYKKLPPEIPGKAYLGSTACVLAGLAGYIFSLWVSTRLGITDNSLFSLVFPMAFATICTGLLLIVTRKQALSQIFGYLVMENGIYLLGVPSAHSNPVWLELSILLDILAGLFVMGIAIHHIHKAFDTTDVDCFTALRD